MGLRHAVTVGIVVAAFATSACKRKPTESTPPPLPPDHLAKGEVALSKDKAFALALPAGSHIGSRFGGDIRVLTPLPPEELANFVRKRVTGGDVIAGATQTRFENVTIPEEPKRVLTIEIQAGPPNNASARSSMAVRDVTPVADFKAMKTEEERLKAAGLSPDGKLLDKNKLE